MVKEGLTNELEHMFRDDLIVACQYWGIDISESKSGDSLIKFLAEKMRDEESREKMFATFSDGERDLLGILALSGGAMSYDKLKPYRKIYSYGQLNQTERDLRKKGIIIRRMMSRVTDYGREVAEFKIIDFFIPHLRSYFARKPESNPEKPKRVRKIVNERDTLLLDMLLLVSYLAKNEVRMTSSWEFPKREADQITDAMSQDTEERFDLVQRIARKAGAYRIVEEDRVIPGNVDVLFSGNQAEVSLKILRSALGRTRAIWATPDQPTEYTLNLVICRLRESTKDAWIHISELRDWIRSELFIEKEPLKWIQVSEERVALALETPVLLGLVEAAYKRKKLLAVRLTEVGEQVIARKKRERVEGLDTFIVQPNFDITVFTTEMDYSKLYKLIMFAEPVKTDVVSKYKITDKSVFQAVEVGFREKDIIEFLKNESTKPIPRNVSRSIQDWMSQTTFASISNVMLLETENEKDMESLDLIPDFKKYVVRQIGPTAVIIRGEFEEIDDDLGKYKVHVTHAERKQSETEQTSGTGITEDVLLYDKKPLNDVPEACIACPALQSCNRVVRRKVKKSRRNNK